MKTLELLRFFLIKNLGFISRQEFYLALIFILVPTKSDLLTKKKDEK